MKILNYQWLAAVTLLGLSQALYGWGALSLVRDLGPIANLSAKRQGALTWTYMHGGRWLIDHAGAKASALRYAEATFAPARAGVVANPTLAMALLHGHPVTFAHRVLQWAHWGTPLALMLTAIAYVFRQKRIMTTRRIR